MLDERVLAELSAAVEGDLGFIGDLVETYASDSGALVEAVEACLAAGDADALVRPAHTLKSSSATLGAMEVSAMSRTLELAGRSGTLEDPSTRAAAAGLRAAWESSTAALRSWVAARARDE